MNLIKIISFVGLQLMLIFCSYSSGNQSSTINDPQFYEEWQTKTLEKFKNCCKEASIFDRFQNSIKFLSSQRIHFSDSLNLVPTIENPVYIIEYFSETNESQNLSILVFSNSIGKKAVMNYQGKITVIPDLYEQGNSMFENKDSCCLFEKTDYEIFKNDLPIICESFIEKTKSGYIFKVSIKL